MNGMRIDTANYWSQAIVTVLAIVCIAALESGSNAAVVPVISLVSDPPGTPFLTPEAALDSSWASYQLSLQSTAGEQIQAVDVRVNGTLHQRWTDMDFDGIPDPTPTGNASDGRGDSHLTSPGNALFGLGPFENNSGNGSPLPDVPGAVDYGLGSILRAAWAFNVVPTTNAKIAYVVIPRDSLTQLKYNIYAADPNGDKFAAINSECPGSVCTVPNIDVTGNDVDIADGDGMPSSIDGTNFGTVTKGSLQQRTFTIYSAGQGDLTLGLPTFTGPFSLVSSFDTLLSEGFSDSFTVRLDTSALGTYPGSVSFATNDPTATPFNFSLSATVVPEPPTVLLGTLGLAGLFISARRRRVL
jgi:hypothetical protein